MHANRNDIEDIFSKKLQNHRIKPTDEEWNKLYSRLRFSNFLRFSVMSFNIYYLSVLIVLAGTTTLTTLNNQKLNKKIEELTNRELAQEMNYKSQKKDSVPLNPPQKRMEITELKEKNVNPVKVSKTESVPPKETRKEPEEINKTVETGNTAAVIITEAKEIKKDTTRVTADTTVKVKKVKRTVLVKSQTVVLKDTVVVKKTQSK